MPPVLVVGAGPSGLVAALNLVLNDVPVRIIEKLPEFHTASRGAGAHSRSLEMYHYLGALDGILKTSVPMHTMASYKLPGGREVTRNWKIWDSEPPSPSRPIVSGEGVTIAQHLLEGVLRDRLAQLGGKVELATELISFEQDSQGVNAILRKHAGTDKEVTEEARFAYVIGADGAKGVTRRQIGATFEGETRYLDGQVWADADVENLSWDYWHLWSEPEKFTVSIRPSHIPGNFHIGIMGMNFDPIDLVDKEKFVNFIREKTERHEFNFTNWTSMSYWKPKMRMVNKFSNGRAFIVGDAGHVHSPTGGQGLNTSVQDSWNLAWKVALAYKGIARPELLESYDAERMPVVAVMLSTTSGLYGHLIARKNEDSIEDRENESRFLRWNNATLSQLEINYRWSPVVYDARGNGTDVAALKARAYTGYPGEDVHAGDRAPGAPHLVDASGKETTLHNIFKPNLHTILIFSPETAAANPQVEAVLNFVFSLIEGTCQVVVLARNGLPKPRGGAAAYHDKEGYAFNGYRVEEGKLTVVAVRPDTYIGAFVFDAQGLQTYFSRIFRSY